MRRLVLAAWVLGACSDASAPPDAAPILEDEEGRVASYQFDDEPTDGVHATVGHDGTCHRCPALVTVDGRTGYQFDGTAEIITAVMPPALATRTGFTVTATARLDAQPPEAGCLANAPFGAAHHNGWQLCIGTELSVFVCMEGAAPDGCFGTGPDGIQLGTVHHLALTVDGATARVFVDGTEVLTRAATWERDDNPLALGADLDSGAPVRSWNGFIDEITLWGRALTADEIQRERAR